LRKSCDTHLQGNAKLDQEVMGRGKMMVTLSGGYVVKQAYQLLTNQVHLIKKEVLDNAEDDRIGEDGGVERMGSVGGQTSR
jgi:hypothetical protein